MSTHHKKLVFLKPFYLLDSGPLGTTKIVPEEAFGVTDSIGSFCLNNYRGLKIRIFSPMGVGGGGQGQGYKAKK